MTKAKTIPSGIKAIDEHTGGGYRSGNLFIARICEIYKDDVHAAPNIRVNGNVYLMDELYDVFDITDGSLYVRREDRIHIW